MIPRWVAASIELAVAIVLVSGILFCGYVVSRYPHAGETVRNSCQPAQGAWFCIAGVFGNAC